jgi:hypothetical protein
MRPRGTAKFPAAELDELDTLDYILVIFSGVEATPSMSQKE